MSEQHSQEPSLAELLSGYVTEVQMREAEQVAQQADLRIILGAQRSVRADYETWLQR